MNRLTNGILAGVQLFDISYNTLRLMENNLLLLAFAFVLIIYRQSRIQIRGFMNPALDSFSFKR